MERRYTRDALTKAIETGTPMLKLDLDELYTDGYMYSDYDISGAGHGQVIMATDQEAFLDEYAAMFRSKVKAFLKPYNPEE